MPKTALMVVGHDALQICEELTGPKQDQAQLLLAAIQNSRIDKILAAADSNAIEALAAEALSAASEHDHGALAAVIDEALAFEQLGQVQQSDMVSQAIAALPYVMGLIICLRVRKLRAGDWEIDFFKGVPSELKDLVSHLMATSTDTIDAITKRIKPPQ